MKKQVFIRTAAVLPLVLLAAFFVFRQRYLEIRLRNLSDSLEKKYGWKLECKQASWSGLATVRLPECTLWDADRSILFRLQNADVHLSLNPLSQPVQSLRYEACHIHPEMIRTVFSRRAALSQEVGTGENLQSSLLRYIPLSFTGMETHISADSSLDMPELYFREIYMNQGLVRADGVLRSAACPSALFFISGVWNAELPEADLRLTFPAKEVQINEHLSISGLRMKLFADAHDESGWGLWLSASPLSIRHAALSDTPYPIDSLVAELNVSRNRDGLSTRALITINNDIHLASDLSYVSGEDAWHFHVSCPVQDAKKFFAALPGKEMQPLRSLNVWGEFSWDAGFIYHDKTQSLENFQFSFTDAPVGVSGWDRLPRRIQYHPSSEAMNIPLAREAVIWAEDPHFHSHNGVDAKGLETALRENLNATKFVRGGGTITMQLARNLWLGKQRTLNRKAAEILLAFLMEQEDAFTKDAILSEYLGMAEWGPGMRGMESAARGYFHRPLLKLNADEICFLAILLPNPLHYADLLNADGTLTENTITVMEGLRLQLWEAGLVSDEEFEKEIYVKVDAENFHPATEAMAAGN